MKLVQRFARVEPVEGLRAEHGVERCIRQSDVLRVARQWRHRGQIRFEPGTHGIDGLRRHDIGPGGGQQSGELPVSAPTSAAVHPPARPMASASHPESAAGHSGGPRASN